MTKNKTQKRKGKIVHKTQKRKRKRKRSALHHLLGAAIEQSIDIANAIRIPQAGLFLLVDLLHPEPRVDPLLFQSVITLRALNNTHIRGFFVVSARQLFDGMRRSSSFPKASLVPVVIHVLDEGLGVWVDVGWEDDGLCREVDVLLPRRSVLSDVFWEPRRFPRVVPFIISSLCN